MHIQKKITSTIIIALLVLFSSFSFVEAKENKAQVIRVGYVNNYGIHSTSDNISGYLFDYLNEIAKHTGWQYEFVEVEWEKGLKMLEEGSLDFFGPMQKTRERENIYAFPQQELGQEYGALYISSDRDDIYYEDVASFDGLDVATIKGSYYESALQQYCLDNQITMNLIPTDASYLSQGLKKKEYDMVLGVSTLDIEDSVIAKKMDPNPFYLATSINKPHLANAMDDAIAKIKKDNTYYESNLFNTHYADKAISLPTFTVDEVAYLKQHQTIKIICNGDWLPITYYNEKTNEMEGIGIDLLKAVGEEIGVTFELEVSYNHQDAMEKVQNNEVDLMFGFIKYDHATMNYSDSIIDIPLVIVGKQDITKEGQKQIGYYRASETVSQELQKIYPNFDFVQYENIQQLIDALTNNKEQYVMFNYYASEEVKWRNPSANFNVAVTDINFAIDMGADKNNDPLLLAIINKGIQRLSAEQISTIIYDNSASRSDEYIVQRLFNEHRQLIFIIVLLAVFGLLFIIAILTQRKKSALQKMAYYDSLTHIYTIEKFRIDAKNILSKAHQNKYTILYLDINNFKYINNTYGYECGDIVLQHVVSHIQKFKTNVSGKDHYLFGRISGDHFVLLVSDEYLIPLLEHLIRISNDTLTLNDIAEAFIVHLSIGYYAIEDNSDDLNILLDKANYARKISKVSHDNNIEAYTKQMHETLLWEKEVTMNMENSLKNGEFSAYFQPKYDFKNEQLVGAEALARWNHPEHGMIPPIKFIPIFEKNGFIKKFDFYILEETCRFLSDCKQANLPLFPISINLSRVHLQDKRLCEHILSIVTTYQVEHKYIEIELTENVLMEDIVSIIEVMKQLRNAGFTISIDDFGSEYSSLRLVSQLPVDVLKIDKAFVDHCFDNEKGKNIIKKIIELADVISLKTVAEGVETKQQAQLLKDMGCDIAQGYYYSKPLIEKDFIALLKRNM